MQQVALARRHVARALEIRINGLHREMEAIHDTYEWVTDYLYRLHVEKLDTARRLRAHLDAMHRQAVRGRGAA